MSFYFLFQYGFIQYLLPTRAQWYFLYSLVRHYSIYYLQSMIIIIL